MPQLIVNADDFGFSALTNDAILYCHQHGIVTSTTVMINLPAAREGLGKARREAPQLGLGLHINLTHGHPILPAHQVSSLVDKDGLFFLPENLLPIAGQMDGDELYQEIAAQIEQFKAITGHLPTHLDSHFHIAFIHPRALEATLALAAENNLPLREILVHHDRQVLMDKMQRLLPAVPEAFLNGLLDALLDVLQKNPPPYSPARFNDSFHRPYNNTLGDLLNILTTLSSEVPTELMCHPAFADDPDHPIGDVRQRETDALTHEAAHEVIEKMKIHLISYADLPYHAKVKDGS